MKWFPFYDSMVGVTIVVTLVWATLNHFIYEWSGNSKGTAWMAATDESVFQHMKMMLWPWIIVIFTFDFLWRALSRQPMGIVNNRCFPSFQNIFGSNVCAICFGMLFMSIFFAIMWYGSGQQELLVPNIILFVVSVVGSLLLRLVLFKHPQVTTWACSAILLYGIVWLFTYTSYRENLRSGFWFDPHHEED